MLPKIPRTGAVKPEPQGCKAAGPLPCIPSCSVVPGPAMRRSYVYGNHTFNYLLEKDGFLKVPLLNLCALGELLVQEL